MRARRLAFWSGGIIAALLVAAPRPGLAAADERVAVELLKSETPRDGALAFERACYRLGVASVQADPLQLFQHHGVSYVRLAVDGPPLVSRCLNLLEPGRRGVSGAIHWLDGFAGGLVVNQPSPAADDRVPDAEWIKSATPTLTLPPVDSSLVDQLSHGGSEAIEKLNKLALDAALVQVRALIARGGPGALATLEIVAKKHPHWRVRRAAVEALSPFVSQHVLIDLAQHDPAWEVRTGAVIQLQTIANAAIPAATAESPDAANVLLELLQHDPSWELRRQVIWSLSSELVERGKDTMRTVMAHDPEPQVRAAALESLVGARLLSHAEARSLLHDPAPIVRAVAASAVAGEMTSSDAPALWKALNDPERIVRLAAAAFLTRITDPTIGPRLWELYRREARELDADPAFEHAALDELGRAPFPELPGQLAAALSTSNPSPDERRLLTRLLARVAPAQASAIMEPALTSPDHRLRSIAADAAPGTPAARKRRLELLSDPDLDVRAGAILGLCRTTGDDAEVRAAVAQVTLGASPLAQEAARAVPHCGQKETSMPFLHTTLAAAAATSSPNGDDSFIPAVAGILLMLISVVAIKLAGGPKQDDKIQKQG